MGKGQRMLRKSLVSLMSGLDNRLEMGIDKHGDTFSRTVKGRNNGAIRIVEFMDFEGGGTEWGTRIRDMEEGDLLGGKTMNRTSILKEGEKGFVIGVSKIMGEVSGSV